MYQSPFKVIAFTLLFGGAVLAAGCGGGTADDGAANQATTASDTAGASAGQNATGADTEEVTREVVQRHLATLGAGDLEGVLADYADDAVMFTPNGPVQGTEALREAFEGIIAEWSQEGTTFELIREEYVGEHGYLNWTAETADNIYHYGADGFTVRDGQIVVQFFSADIEPKP